MKTILSTLMLTGFFVLPAKAQLLTAPKGLEKIKTNLENAQKNKDEYAKNLELVKTNAAEVQKAKEATQAQKKIIYGEIVKNNDSLKKVLLQERDISIYITKENDKIALETKQIEQLQAMINQIKKNQEQRALIISDYNNQLNAAGNTKKAWKDREAQLRAQEAQTMQSLRGIASEEASWLNKKKKYESEVKRWTAEAEKQKKIHDTYQGLAEGK